VLSRERIVAICSRFAGRGWYVDSSPGADRLQNVLTTWKHPPPSAESVVALLDASPFRNGKAGVAICEHGIHWNADIIGLQPGALRWEELGAAAVRPRGKDDLQIGAGSISFAGGGMERGDLLACLLQLRQAAVDAGAPRHPAFVPPGLAFPGPGEPPPGLQVLRELMAGAGLGALVAPGIPAKKLGKAADAMRIPPDETVQALVDDTVFGSAKVGMAVGTRGIYWNNPMLSGGEGRPHRSWDELVRTRVAVCNKDVMVGDTDWISLSTTAPALVLGLVLRAQWWARAQLSPEERRAAIAAAFEADPDAPVASSAAEPPRWHLAMNGQQFGPYPRAAVGEMIAAGQVAADACFAWAEGMPAWVPLREVPELAALLAPPAPAPPPVPRTPPAPAPAPAPAPTVAAAAVTEEERVDVNTAEVDELLVLPGITLAQATLLVHERQTRGGFRDVEQVGQALRLQPHVVERWRHRVAFGRMTAAAGRVVDF
jgi:GYF domain 2/Helix-hairpin-helix motif